MLRVNMCLAVGCTHIGSFILYCFVFHNFSALVATTISDLTLPCKERLTVARHIHIMAGCSPILYWLVTFVYHMAAYTCFCATATLTAAAYFDNDHTLDDKATLG